MFWEGTWGCLKYASPIFLLSKSICSKIQTPVWEEQIFFQNSHEDWTLIWLPSPEILSFPERLGKWHAQICFFDWEYFFGLEFPQSLFCCAYMKNHESWGKRRGAGSSATEASSTKSFLRKKIKIFRLQSKALSRLYTDTKHAAQDIFSFFP